MQNAVQTWLLGLLVYPVLEEIVFRAGLLRWLDQGWPAWRGWHKTDGLTTAPQDATINAQTGVITRATSTAGSYNFNVIASDGKGGVTAQTFTLTVKPVNDASAANNASYTPRKGYTGADSFSYTVSDGKLSASGAISLNVGQASSASIVVNSSAVSTGNSTTTNTSTPVQYVLVNSATSASSSSASSNVNTSASASSQATINWLGSPSSSTNSLASASSSNNNWLAELLKADDEHDNLLNSTGLKVKL